MASTLVEVPTASPGPPTTETAGLLRPKSDLSAVFGPWFHDDSIRGTPQGVR